MHGKQIYRSKWSERCACDLWHSHVLVFAHFRHKFELKCGKKDTHSFSLFGNGNVSTLHHITISYVIVFSTSIFSNQNGKKITLFFQFNSGEKTAIINKFEGKKKEKMKEIDWAISAGLIVEAKFIVLVNMRVELFKYQIMNQKHETSIFFSYVIAWLFEFWTKLCQYYYYYYFLLSACKYSV